MDERLSSLQASTAKSPDIEALTQKGYAFLRKGDLDEATAIFAQSIAAQPTYEAALGLNSILHQDVNNAKARSALVEHYPLGWTGFVRITTRGNFGNLEVYEHKRDPIMYRHLQTIDDVAYSGGQLYLLDSRGSLYRITTASLEQVDVTQGYRLLALPDFRDVGIVHADVMHDFIELPQGAIVYDNLPDCPHANLESSLVLGDPRKNGHFTFYDKISKKTSPLPNTNFATETIRGIHVENDELFFYQPENDSFHSASLVMHKGESGKRIAQERKRFPGLLLPEGSRWTHRRPRNIARNEYDLIRNTVGTTTIEVPITMLDRLRELADAESE